MSLIKKLPLKKIFLTAEWRKLAMANYAIDKSLLTKHLPYKTELDFFGDTCYVSLIGFMFLNTRMKNIGVPFHKNFPEVNLRFYVRYKDGNIWKRGAVFISEVVPLPALALVANTIYGEHYETMRMKHNWQINEKTISAEYKWKKGDWNTFKVTAENKPKDISIGSEAEFITEHYWGYTQRGATKTSEYGVEHQRWQIYDTTDYIIDVDFKKMYGYTFAFLKNETPTSVFLVEGSEILIREGSKI